MRKRNPAEIRQLVARNAPPEFVPTSAHHIRRYLHITAALGASAELLPPRLTVAGAEVETARSKFGLTEQHFWIGLAPGAEYGPAKRWPAERFAETARAFREKTRCRPVLFGGPGDRDVAQAVEAAIGQPVLNLAGKTSLRELAAALKTCKVVLSNDSGPMHLAAALGVPVVALFGSTSPELTAPPGVRVLRQAPPCAPCFLRQCPIDLRCLRDIEVSAVVKEVSQQCIGTGRAGDSTAA